MQRTAERSRIADPAACITIYSNGTALALRAEELTEGHGYAGRRPLSAPVADIRRALAQRNAGGEQHSQKPHTISIL